MTKKRDEVAAFIDKLRTLEVGVYSHAFKLDGKIFEIGVRVTKEIDLNEHAAHFDAAIKYLTERTSWPDRCEQSTQRPKFSFSASCHNLFTHIVVWRGVISPELKFSICCRTHAEKYRTDKTIVAVIELSSYWRDRIKRERINASQVRRVK